MKFKFIVFRTIHFIVVLLVAILPFVINWRIVALIAILNYVVFGLYFKKCPLSEWQFGKNGQGFVQYYLEMLGIKLSNRQNVILMRYIVPLTIVTFSYFWQEIVKG